MKKLYLILSLLFISVVAHAQPYETNPDFNRTRNWHFGHGVGLRFDPDTIYEVPTSIHTDEAAAVHTDIDGNLLLYSNGESIWNAEHQVIQNGNLTLGHHSSGMGSVFVFHENSPDSIYLFNTFWNISSTKEFSINLIVREDDTFRVVYKDSVLMYNVCEPIAVVKADNGKDVWITVHEFGANNIYSFLLTSNGLVSCPIISNSKISPIGSPNAAAFDMIFSPNGKFLIRSITNLPPPIIEKVVEIYEFDNSNGSFTFLYSLDNFIRPYTCLGFSKDNSKIFVIERDSGLNILEFNPKDSFSTINSLKRLQATGQKFQLQNLTYGSHMVWSISNSSYLALVKNTDDIDSIYITTSEISLNGGMTRLDLPNFNQSYFHTPPINFSMELNCISNTIQFYGKDTFSSNSHSWLITKQGTSQITNNTKAPLIQFEDTGTYQVRYIASNGSRSDTISKDIVVLPKIPENFLGNDTGWCEQLDASINLQAPSGMYCYEWSNGNTSTSITADTTGIYWAKIVTPNFCVLYDTITVTIDTMPNNPTIYRDNDTLKTDEVSPFYQWLKDGSSTGTNSPKLFLTDTGVYSLSIRNNGGCTASSDTIHIPAEKDTLNDNVSIVIFDGIKIYPNPFNNSVIIENPNLEYVQLNIYSIEGRVTVNKRLHNNLDVINTEHWTVGIYLIKLTSQNGLTRTFKLIKISE